MGSPITTFHSPYIHSNIDNYKQYANKNILPSTGKAEVVQGFTQIVNELNQTRTMLYNRARSFLGVDPESLTRAELDRIFKGDDKDYQDMANAAIQFLYQPKNYTLLSPEKTVTKKQASKILQDHGVRKKVVEEIEKTLFSKGDIIDLNLFQKEIRKYLQKALGDYEIQSGKGAANLQNIKGLEALEKIVYKEFTKKLKNAPIITSPYSVLNNYISKLSEQVVGTRKDLYKELDIKNNSTAFINQFKTHMFSTFSNRDSLFKEKLTKYVDACAAEFYNDLSTIVPEIANISGGIQEFGLKSVLSNTPNSVEIEVIGSASEKSKQNENGEWKKGVQAILREKLGKRATKINKKIMKDYSAQSYSDWLVTRNGVTVRVQSKNSAWAVRDFFEKKENRSTYLTLLQEDISATDFVNKIMASGNLFAFDENMFGYVIANEYWFAHHKSVSRNKSNSSSGGNNANIMKQLADGILNYLGVIIPNEFDVNNEAAASNSNIFWLVTGNYYPTYKIIDGMLNYFNTKKDETLASFSVKVHSSTSINAPTLYKQKMEALDEHKINWTKDKGITNHYEIDNLVAAGQKVGKEIIDNYTIQSLKMKLPSMEGLMQSAFTFYR